MCVCKRGVVLYAARIAGLPTPACITDGPCSNVCACADWGSDLYLHVLKITINLLYFQKHRHRPGCIKISPP